MKDCLDPEALLSDLIDFAGAAGTGDDLESPLLEDPSLGDNGRSGELNWLVIVIVTCSVLTRNVCLVLGISRLCDRWFSFHHNKSISSSTILVFPQNDAAK